MKLYMVPAAPNPTRVLLYLAERAQQGTELPIEQVVVNTLKGRHLEPEHLARNPFGTLPVLELEDGSHLVESVAIMLYLEDRFPEGALFGAEVAARAHARDLERLIELRLMLPMGRYVHAVNSPLKLPPNPELAKTLEKDMQKPLDFLEARLGDERPLLMGERVSPADCTLQAGFQFLRFGKAELLDESRPRLLAWDARYRERPAARQVLKF